MLPQGVAYHCNYIIIIIIIIYLCGTTCATWKSTSAEEMHAFMAINMAMGIDQSPEYKDAWSGDPIVRNLFIRSVMSRTRYEKLSQYMHCSVAANEVAGDKLAKVRPIITLCEYICCSIAVRLALFRSFCSPMYTSHLRWNYKKRTMKRLLITYHNVFKMSISMSKYESTSLLCTVYNVLCCQAVIRNLVYRFMCRLQASNNHV